MYTDEEVNDLTPNKLLITIFMILKEYINNKLKKYVYMHHKYKIFKLIKDGKFKFVSRNPEFFRYKKFMCENIYSIETIRHRHLKAGRFIIYDQRLHGTLFEISSEYYSKSIIHKYLNNKIKEAIVTVWGNDVFSYHEPISNENIINSENKYMLKKKLNSLV